MASDEQLTLFDLIGRSWADDEAQSVVSHYNGLKAIKLDKGCIYDFRDSGVKFFAGKIGDGNEISEIYIYDAEHRIYEHQRLAKMPCDLRIGQTQERARALLGKPYDAHIGHTYPPPRIPGVICALPRRENGWDCYHSSQLTGRLKIHPLKPFLLTIEYPLGWGGLKQIRDAEEKILLIVPEHQRVGKMVLKLSESALPKRCGLRSVDEILERDAQRRSIIEGWDV
jgi:hypothetical protein